METLSLDGGFSEPVLAAQTAFRAIMDALANPGTIRKLGTPPGAPAGLPAGLAAVALTLCDHDSPLWLDPGLAEDEAVAAWLRFHTGAPLVTDPAASDFALVADPGALPQLDRFALGSDQYPDRSTTIVLAVPALTGGAALTFKGPGIRDAVTVAPQGLPADFATQWSANHALFPRGVDLLLVSDTGIAGLPRSSRLMEG
ncbi:MAG TPA: phosphonate C-P lyase system protein PhnH [Devosia sp.]|nr:phosphonate C-P lyase system protein PhnH [Devosia sp.]